MDSLGNIGLGKAGNNPYQWLALGGAGLQSMLANKPNYDPEAMQTSQFDQAALASGKPVGEVPYEPHGLLPLLASKIGLMPSMIKARPSQMVEEQLVLQAQQKQKLSDMLDHIGVLTNLARYAGPKATSDLYNATPGLQFPGLTGQQIAGWKTPGEENLDLRAFLGQQSHELAEDRIGISKERADLAEQALWDKENKGDPAAERDAERVRGQQFGRMQQNLRSQGSSSAGMANADNINKASDFLMNAETSGVDPNEAWKQAQAILNPVEAQDSGGGGGTGSLLRSILPSGFPGMGAPSANAGTLSARPTPTAPKVVRPSFAK